MRSDFSAEGKTKLSILIPVYNEAATVATVLKRVLDVEYPCDYEVIVVDDGSHDGTLEVLAGLNHPKFSLVRHDRNRGKGAAIRTAALKAGGDYMIIFDADLEYYPEDIPSMLKPVLDAEARVVFGTRTFGSHTAYSFWFVMGNKLVTMFANVLFNAWITDLETCLKLLPVELYRALDIRSTGFGMEAEITGKLLKAGIRPYEIPIQYKARSREEGKKLTWWDGVEALWILLRVRLSLQGVPPSVTAAR